MVTPGMMQSNGIRISQTIDPPVYQEEDDWYLLFGNGEAAVARLSEDMLCIDEKSLQNIEGLKDFREAVTVFRRNGHYHFTWSCDDTGSEDYHVNYGVSDTLYGKERFIRNDTEKGCVQEYIRNRTSQHHEIAGKRRILYCLPYESF